MTIEEDWRNYAYCCYRHRNEKSEENCPPERCQHLRVDNETAKCCFCDTGMIGYELKPETVLSAPNLAACGSPDCSGSIEDPHCHNPGGMYIPDLRNTTEVVIGINVNYVCDRCHTGGETRYTAEGAVFGCGMRHQGLPLPAPRRAPV